MGVGARHHNCCATMCATASHWMRHKASVALNIALLVLFFALDMRDLYYKTVLVGPFDTFSFEVVNVDAFEDTPLVLATPLPTTSTAGATASGPTITNGTRASGWTSLVASCAALHGVEGQFLHVLGRNCSTTTHLGEDHAQPLVDLVMIASLRVDAVAWTSCRLLVVHRRPQLCQSPMVTTFLQRYRLPLPTVPVDGMAMENSPAEDELLAMLLLISQSTPWERVTCVEAFEFSGPGEYVTTMIGCGSSNALRSAFIGRHATFARDLHHSLAWLTLDRLSVFGLDLSLRQNVYGRYDLRPDASTGLLTMSSTTFTNFSSSGALYNLMIFIDAVLLVTHALGAVEIVNKMLLPLLRTRDLTSTRDFERDHYTSIFSRSLYRSHAIVVLTVVSQLLAWPYVLANSIIWTWSQAATGRVQAFLTSLRFWVFLLVCFNACWDVCVVLHEPWAFAISQRTYVTTIELGLIGAFIVFLERERLFGIGRRTYSNAYNHAYDYQGTVSMQQLEIIYSPLLCVVGMSIVTTMLFLLARLLYLHYWRRWVRRSGNAVEPSTQCSSVDFSIPYRRLSLEILLDTPVRARSLMRNAFSTEIITEGRTVSIRDPNCFDFGLIDNCGHLETRRGFYNVIPLSLEVAKYLPLTESTNSDPRTVVPETAKPGPPNAAINT